MPKINLTQRTHFDLIELLTRFKHEWFDYVETYEAQLKERPNDPYVNSDKPKALYKQCIDNLELCDRIIKELKEEPNNINVCPHRHTITVTPLEGNATNATCTDCGTVLENWKGDARFE